MANYAYERLSAQDASFLLFETPNEHMHLAWMWVFESGPLVDGDGGIDIRRIRRHVAARLFRFPRFRQKLAYTPLERHPVWVDDESFKIHYHVQHVSLPEPGDAERLWGTVSALVSQPLDHSKPLWELWVVEGLANGGFAIVSKTHHCMVDGVASVDLMTGLLDDRPDGVDEEPSDWIARPAPDTSDLLFATIRDRAALAFAPWPGGIGKQIGDMKDALLGGLSRAPTCPLNQPIGPHRLARGTRFRRDTVEQAATRLEASVDDVALAVVAGGLRRFLAHQGFDPSAAPLRVAMPARAPRDGDTTNRVSARLLALPTHLEDPRARVSALVEAGKQADAHGPSLDGEGGWLRLAEAAGHTILGLGVEVRRWLHSFNLIVTAMPGPAEPRYLVGSKLISAYPQVPLFHNQALSVAIASYFEHIQVGLVADWEILPDLVMLADDIQVAFAETTAA